MKLNSQSEGLRSSRQSASSRLSIVSGSLRGTKLASPRSSATHPMGSREKLALFNMLQPYLGASSVLDAYAGSGALGLESLSRGAKTVIFVEKSPQSAAIIAQNLARLGFDFPIFTESVTKFAQRAEFQSSFDVIIADPPYNNFDPRAVALLTPCLKPRGIFALSCPASSPPPQFAGLELICNREYARARIALYRAADA